MTIKIKTFTRTNDVPDDGQRYEFMNTSALVIFSTSFENDVIECGYDVDCECT